VDEYKSARSQRQDASHIFALETTNGWETSVLSIPDVCGDHFAGLFASRPTDAGALSGLLEHYAPEPLSADTIAELELPLAPVEVLAAAARGKSLRAPGPDGLVYEV
jgi:hypothetical protein